MAVSMKDNEGRSGMVAGHPAHRHGLHTETCSNKALGHKDIRRSAGKGVADPTGYQVGMCNKAHTGEAQGVAAHRGNRCR